MSQYSLVSGLGSIQSQSRPPSAMPSADVKLTPLEGYVPAMVL